eukprot:6953303-Pyramimonas_sp.AAC.1
MQPSKAGLYDEALVLDNSEYFDLVPGLQLLRRGAGPRLFPFEYTELARHFGAAVRLLNLEVIGINHPYQCRHGGASHEIASGRAASRAL